MSTRLRVPYTGPHPPIAVHHDWASLRGTASYREHAGGCGPSNPVCVALGTPGGAPACPDCTPERVCAQAAALVYDDKEQPCSDS